MCTTGSSVNLGAAFVSGARAALDGAEAFDMECNRYLFDVEILGSEIFKASDGDADGDADVDVSARIKLQRREPRIKPALHHQRFMGAFGDYFARIEYDNTIR